MKIDRPPHIESRRARVIVDSEGKKVLAICRSCRLEKYILEERNVCSECWAPRKKSKLLPVLRFDQRGFSNMSKKISVTPLDRSYDGNQPLDRKSYRVTISGDGQTKIVEARVPLSVLEKYPRPEEYIEKWFEARPMPQSGIVDL